MTKHVQYISFPPLKKSDGELKAKQNSKPEHL